MLVGDQIVQNPLNCIGLVASRAPLACQCLCVGLLILVFAVLVTASSSCRAAERSTDSNWSKGLTIGVNGPIPVIVVDQFGYPTKAAKFAVIRNPQVGYDSMVHFTPGENYALIDRATGVIVKHGAPISWNDGGTDPVSGDKAWWFDFSDVTTPGTYVVLDLDKGLRSAEFEIDDNVYRTVIRHAVRVYFYQRAGFEKTATTAGPDWADGASHLRAGQDLESRPWEYKSSLVKADASRIKDLHGGWFDAGDYNKYTSWTAQNVIVLLRAYEENPDAFGDDSGIAESGNGIPDILDEIKWALDWLKRTQNKDGSLFCVQGLDQASPPSAATGPSYYGPATTAASLMGAAAFAYASKIYSARAEASLRHYGNDLATRAKQAWDWAIDNPRVLYYNNDDAKQPGSRGLAAGQQEMDDSERLFAKFQAAVYLYELTDDAIYKSFIESNYMSIAPSDQPLWISDRQETLLYYTRLPNISVQVKSAILTGFIARVTGNADQLPMITDNRDPYRAPIKAHFWGSNSSKARQARIYQLLAIYGSDAVSTATANFAALGYIHYLHGVNPIGLAYLTNMKSSGAEHSARTMFHNWFTHSNLRWSETSDATPGPPPGYLVGGPNQNYSMDKCCAALVGSRCFLPAAHAMCRNRYAPPLRQPPLKSYRQFNEGWPANSWEITEPSTAYQAQYIRVLARYVH